MVSWFPVLFLFTQIQKQDSTDNLLSSLMVDLTKLLCNPRAWKQHITDRAQKPLAPTSTAKRCMVQPLNSMVVFSGRYLVNFSSWKFFMFSSHGQVNSIRINFLAELENMKISIRVQLNCLWNVISLINFFEGPRDKVSVVFAKLFFRGFGSVYIPNSMTSLVMITSHLLKLNVLICHTHSFLNLPGTSHQFGRAAGDNWVTWTF